MLPEAYFIQLGIITISAVIIVGFIRFLRQPLIIGYILTGILLGPYFLGLTGATETIRIFSQLGVAFLLFTVGIGLNPHVIKEVGKVSLITGVGQVLFTTGIGYGIARILGFVPLHALYLAVALSFSSTIIIMKLLYDKGDTEKLYGRIAIGFLIVQDIIAVIILMAVSSFSGGRPINVIWDTLLSGITLLIVLGLFSVYLLPRLVARVAKSQEFLFLFAIGWSLAVASLFHAANFSLEIGALLAGMALSISPYRYEISAKMKPLRDFFVVLFFVFLGTQLGFDDIRVFITPAIVLSLFVLVGNPLIVMALMGALGYTSRNSFRAGLTVAQISEFSLILIALGATVGHLDRSLLSLVTLVGIITIAGSSYMILYSDRIFLRLAHMLRIFERPGKKVDRHRIETETRYKVILFGYNRIGYDILNALAIKHISTIVIDYNPEVIKELTARSTPCLYGDATDLELLQTLGLEHAAMLISTIPDIDTNMLLMRESKKRNPKIIIIVAAHQIDHANMLYEAGASYVILPHFLGGTHVAQMITARLPHKLRFDQIRAEHLAYLNARKRAGHEHPPNQPHGIHHRR